MPVYDEKTNEVNAKIVYYGPGLSGKTTNIHYIYRKLKPEHKGKLTVLATQTDRTLFFDFLPIELGEIRGMKTRFQVYTVPGQVFYNATRKLILKNVDGIVFVADSARDKLAQNIESFENLEENLAFYKRSLKDIPHVLQFNKRDLPDISSVEELNRALNKYNAPYIEACATKGKGVLETLTTICKMVLRAIKESMEAKTEGKVFVEAPVQKVEEVKKIEEVKKVEEKPLILFSAGEVKLAGDGEVVIPISLKDKDGNLLKEIEVSFKFSVKEKEGG
jgi:signal recognition particle receptor subunit beta